MDHSMMDDAYDGVVERQPRCDFTPTPERQGNWIGHYFPGIIFVIWGTHWLTSAYWRYFLAKQARQVFRSRSTEPILPFLKPMRYVNDRVPLESILKAIFGFLLFFLQIYYGSYKYLYCPADTPRAGRLASQHLNSWAHGAMNLGFMVSGLVELMGHVQELPDGAEMGVLSVAFFIEFLLMGLHEKHGSLDSGLHKLLAYTMLAGSLFSGLQIAFPNSLSLSAARSAAMILQGTWFCQSGTVLFGGHKFWEDKYMLADGKTPFADMAPAMLLPVTLSFHIVAITLFAACTYTLVGFFANGWHLTPPPRSSTSGVAGGACGQRCRGEAETTGNEVDYERTGLLTDAREGQQGGDKMVALAPLPAGSRYNGLNHL